MEEHKRVTRQVLQRDFDNIPSACEPCMSVPYAPLGLESPGPQPLVREAEALATMVVLPVVDPNRASVLEHCAVRRHAIWNAREQLRQVERGVGGMTDPEKEHLPVQIVHSTDRALGDVGRKWKRAGGDPGSLRSGRREGVEVIASQHAGQPPERIRDDSEARRRWGGEGGERIVVVSRPGRHHQGAVGTEGVTERLDQSDRPSLDRSYSPERRVCQQDTAFPDSELAELNGNLGAAHLRHSRLHFPRNSPIGASDSMWSQAILSVAIIGTARIAPGMPQMYHQKTRPMKSATVLSFIRLP